VGLGLRLRYLSGGVSDHARTVDRFTLPERSGYYLGSRMADPAITATWAGLAVPRSAEEITTIGQRERGDGVKFVDRGPVGLWLAL